MAKRINIKGRITGDINAWIYDWLEIPYTSPKSVAKEIELANGEDIEVYVNSGGGSVYDGYEIYNILAEYKGNVTIKIIGLAASAASFISMVPNAKCYMSPLSEMMIHNSSTHAEGPHQAMDNTSNMLKVTDSTIAQAYVLKSGKNENEIKDLMEKESWLTANQAKELGLIDGIMFDTNSESNPVPTLYNALPINDDDLISELEKCKSVDELQVKITENINRMFKTSRVIQPTKVNETVVDENITKIKGGKVMTLENLKAEHGDLFNQIVQDATKEAITKERARIKEIQDLARPGVEDVINQGIEDGLNPGQVAMNILKAQKDNGEQMLNNLINDASLSGVDKIPNAPSPQNTETEEDKKQNAINLLAMAMNGGNN